MNRKVLAALLVFPVVVFASDKIFHISDKISSSSANSNLEEITSHTSFINDEEMVLEMKIAIKDKKGREKAFQESECINMWDEQVKPEERKLIKDDLIDKLQSKNICSIDVKRSFSRCPSGYDAVIITNDKVVTKEGWMLCRSGCDSEPIAKFRYDVKAGTIEAKVSDKAGYIGLDDFCKLYKTAKASM
jgi:hypothetical protein